jgi:phasin
MTDAAAATTKSTLGFAPPGYEEIPEALRETTEKAVAQAKDAYAKAKVATDQATDLLKDTYASAARGATDYNLKIIEFARANANTAFEYAQEMMGVKHPSELIVLSSAHAQKQFETMMAQTKELTEFAKKVTTEATAPLKASVTKALNGNGA